LDLLPPHLFPLPTLPTHSSPPHTHPLVGPHTVLPSHTLTPTPHPVTGLVHWIILPLYPFTPPHTPGCYPTHFGSLPSYQVGHTPHLDLDLLHVPGWLHIHLDFTLPWTTHTHTFTWVTFYIAHTHRFTHRTIYTPSTLTHSSLVWIGSWVIHTHTRLYYLVVTLVTIHGYTWVVAPSLGFMDHTHTHMQPHTHTHTHMPLPHGFILQLPHTVPRLVGFPGLVPTLDCLAGFTFAICPLLPCVVVVVVVGVVVVVDFFLLIKSVRCLDGQWSVLHTTHPTFGCVTCPVAFPLVTFVPSPDSGCGLPFTQLCLWFPPHATHGYTFGWIPGWLHTLHTRLPGLRLVVATVTVTVTRFGLRCTGYG